jgi:hypothetical protein
VVARIRGGLDYPTLLGAVAEASVRQVRPYPHVGFKYHAFMVLQAVHRTRTHGRPEDRWLPVLWAADVFKGSQAAEQRTGSWSLGPVRERLVPPAHKAEDAFRDAMERWDPEAADAAVVDLARPLPRDRLFAPLFHCGARDFRAIGHKAITVANCHRLLGVVAPAHTESMLRSLVLALLNHRGEPSPADSDLAPDRPWRRNLLLATQANVDGESKGEGDNGAIAEILHVLRDGSDEDASRAVDAATRRGIDYKFAEAAFENAAAMQAPWRERYLAAAVLYLNGSADKTNETVRRARSLLG